ARSASGSFRVEVNAGELLDRLSILRIKSERIADEAKRAHILVELAAIEQAQEGGVWPDGVEELAARLKEVNGRLWDVEDALRAREARREFGAESVELARSVYRLNEERGALKRALSECCGSRWVEQKQYGPQR